MVSPLWVHWPVSLRYTLTLSSLRVHEPLLLRYTLTVSFLWVHGPLLLRYTLTVSFLWVQMPDWLLYTHRILISNYLHHGLLVSLLIPLKQAIPGNKKHIKKSSNPSPKLPPSIAKPSAIIKLSDISQTVKTFLNPNHF